MSASQKKDLNATLSQSWVSACACAMACFMVGGILLASTALINRHVRSHPKRFGLEAPTRDARQILVDHLTRDPDACAADSVIVGSSRMRVAGDAIVDGERFFNISAPDMAPAEYGTYLELFKKICRKTPQTILLGFDFFGSSTHHVSIPQPAAYYINKTANPSYRLGLYDDLSISATKRAWDLWWEYGPRKHFSAAKFQQTLKPAEWRQRRDLRATQRLSYRKSYVRDTEAYCITPRVYEATRIGPADSSSRYPHRSYYEEAYGEYFFDPKLPGALRQLNDDNRDSRLVAVLTPISHVLYDELIDHGLSSALASYEVLLGSEFDVSFSFVGPDAVTSDRRNFQDENHLTKPAIDVLLRRVMGEDVGPSRFGRTISGMDMEQLEAVHVAFAEAPRVPRSRRAPNLAHEVAYADISRRRRVEGTRSGDCTLAVKPGGVVDVMMETPSHAAVLEIMTSRKTSIGLELRLGDAIIDTLQVPKFDIPVVGLRTRTLEVPRSARQRGFDSVRIRNNAKSGSVAVAYLAVHDHPPEIAGDTTAPSELPERTP